MARIPRSLQVDVGSTHHCVFRSHNGTRIFEEPAAAEFFLSLLAEYKAQFGIRIHSYVLMGTHPHVVLTAALGQAAFSEFWRRVNHRFAVFFNKRTGRRGQVVMERLKSPAIAPDGRHLLTVMRYGDLNPVRAGLARRAAEWRYSSYRHYAHGTPDPLVDPAPDYLGLGATPAARQAAYRGLFARAHADQVHVTRPDFVRLPFIGPMEWVEAKMRSLGIWPVGPPALA